jgi:hypothetical protein
VGGRSGPAVPPAEAGRTQRGPRRASDGERPEGPERREGPRREPGLRHAAAGPQGSGRPPARPVPQAPAPARACALSAARSKAPAPRHAIVIRMDRDASKATRRCVSGVERGHALA